MQAGLAAHGRKLVVIVDPHIKKDDNYPIYKAAKDKNFFTTDKDGKDYEGWGFHVSDNADDSKGSVHSHSSACACVISHRTVELHLELESGEWILLNKSHLEDTEGEATTLSKPLPSQTPGGDSMRL